MVVIWSVSSSHLLFHAIDYNSTLFCCFIIKLGKKGDGTTVMATVCGRVNVTTMLGVRRKKTNKFSF